jgi:PmbA protein
LAKELQEAVTALKNLDSSIQGVPYNAVSQTKVDHFYASTTGLTQAQSDSSVSAYIYARGQAEGFKPRAAGHWGEEVNLKDLNLLDIAKVAGESLIAHLRPVKIPSGKYPVVLSGRAFIDLLNAFSNLFSAQNIIDKQSLNTRESLGKELASAILNITDDPLHPWNIAPTRFDGEGTNVRRTPLVEKGVLTGLWHHSVSAKAFSTQSTGHARVAAKMSVGPWFYNIDAGAGLGDYASDCIWVEEVQALHAGVNALQGSFSLPFQGFRVQNGHKESLEGVTVAGDILSLLKSIVALSETQERTPGGACPAVAVSELSITCES